jgi:hypothetical protein
VDVIGERMFGVMNMLEDFCCLIGRPSGQFSMAWLGDFHRFGNIFDDHLEPHRFGEDHLEVVVRPIDQQWCGCLLQFGHAPLNVYRRVVSYS